jgi:hypothetical protein
MLLRRQRARHRLGTVAVVLLASLCAGTLAPPHADPLGDLACNPVPVLHDESAHRIGGSTLPNSDHGSHCFLCHLARTFRSPAPAGEQVQESPASIERLHATSVLRQRRTAWSLGPDRAPPA